MGRPSKLTPDQWRQIERRVAAGEVIRALARETEQMLNSAYQSACKIISEQDKKLAELEAVNRELLEALKLALSAHGVLLLSDPPQEAWKTYGVEQKARAAIAKAEGQA
jgi:hypothetical protein